MSSKPKLVLFVAERNINCQMIERSFDRFPHLLQSLVRIPVNNPYYRNKIPHYVKGVPSLIVPGESRPLQGQEITQWLDALAMGPGQAAPAGRGPETFEAKQLDVTPDEFSCLDSTGNGSYFRLDQNTNTGLSDFPKDAEGKIILPTDDQQFNRTLESYEQERNRGCDMPQQARMG